MIVLDTNVVSELMRPTPSPIVITWLERQSSASLFTTTITEAEILFGVAVLPESLRRSALLTAAKQMFEIDFGGRVLPFDSEAAQSYATLAADRRRVGRPAGAFDIQVAAIALTHGATVATRNTVDFEGFGPITINPWVQI